MEAQKDKIIGLGATIGFHLLIILALIFYTLDLTPMARTAEDLGGVPVMFGNVPDAFGDDEPFGRGNGDVGAEEATSPNVVEDPIPMVENTATKTKPAVSNTKEAPVTQNLEETVAIKEAKKKAEEKKQQEADERRKKAEADRVAQQEAAKKGQINNQMAGLFGNGTGSGSRGNTEGTGTQGVPTGNASYGKTSGVGGWGSFDLGGRSLGSGGLIKPNYSVDDYGTVVVDILVNAKGDVVEATIGKGTNTPNTNLRNEALRAAKRTKFNTVSSVTNQKGTITYKFNLN
ncbi:MAG TPA: TonB family protein [Dysgonomonas sp.]|uniref:TonB family protein n=1 Tax=Dysgonomonas mossii TaxID=163665 RepID=A0A4Y9IQB0_9BACT|nr:MULTISPECIES: energy transducer TonB [Dysgonomonas]MBF0759465.1 TonB family protein [Dysgonomonas mossii]MBS5796102.1 TonB family protein [Dysgonomonas mossii]MBS5978434.1 TonB family protein [Dysgonomonas mossii]MBS7110978.1 TonB family protein [Dysgonomonas mossii]TFU90436.1 TonB family protein [Dysgonomonas mossii]